MITSCHMMEQSTYGLIPSPSINDDDIIALEDFGRMIGISALRGLNLTSGTVSRLVADAMVMSLDDVINDSNVVRRLVERSFPDQSSGLTRLELDSTPETVKSLDMSDVDDSLSGHVTMSDIKKYTSLARTKIVRERMKGVNAIVRGVKDIIGM